MNYRHAFHAGNFADVLKHAVLARLITYLKRKDKAFRIIDTHAGIGVYDLRSDEAARSPEWREGIARLLDAELPGEVPSLLGPYLEAVRSLNGADLAVYPGSPVLSRMLMRRQDRLSAIELHPADHATLAAHFEGDHQVRVTHLDGWLALGAHVPPKERRAIVLVDPPFEAPGEYQRMAAAFSKAHRRFPTGLYCLWYPKKAGAPVTRFHESLRESGAKPILVVELDVCEAASTTGLSGCGLALVNPPFTLAGELEAMLPPLAALLSRDGQPRHRLFWLAEEV